jgi:hypothetical protein
MTFARQFSVRCSEPKSRPAAQQQNVFAAKKKEKAFKRPFYSVSPSLATSLGMIKKDRLLQQSSIQLWPYFIS